MFSSSFSLRQNIKAVDTELEDYKVSNNARVDVLETFKANLEGDAAGSIADLETKHNEQAALIATLETNATALKSRIDTFNAALEDGSDGTISTIEQIKLNKDGLTQELLDRASEDVRVEGLVSTLETTTLSLNSTETARATAAEEVLQANIEAENTERQLAIASTLLVLNIEETRAITAETTLQNNITAEATNRAAAIAVETTNRETAIEKVGFLSVCEAEGILVADSFPFCFGMGGQSELKHGLPVPFSYTIRGIGYSCVSSDENPEIVIAIYHNAFINVNTNAILVNSLTITGKSFKTKLSVNSFAGAGHLIVKVLSVNGLTDDTSKFRLSLVLTSNESLYE
jgi:hypothetical protein